MQKALAKEESKTLPRGSTFDMAENKPTKGASSYDSSHRHLGLNGGRKAN